MTQKTNAARLLDQMGIRYELREYEVGPEDLAAEAVAAKIGLPSGQLFKTLVAQGDRHGICMAAIPGDTELDLKARDADQRIQPGGRAHSSHSEIVGDEPLLSTSIRGSVYIS